MKYVNFQQYAPWPSTVDEPVSNPWFVGGGSDFMKILPLAAWFFVGVESLKEVCNDVDDPKVQIPKGQVSCVLTFAVTALMVYFISVSLPPGVSSLASNAIPFNAGFQLMLNLSDQETLHYATILSIPATFATFFGFIMMYGKVMAAMAESKFMPIFLRKTHPRTGAPYMALIVGSVISYGVCLITYWYTSLASHLFKICILAGFCSYATQSVCYILLKTKYSNIECKFHSPFGLYGGVLSLCIWTLGIISVIFFQDDYDAVIAVVVLYAFFTLWYFVHAKYQQHFSDEEKAIFFKIYVINCKL